jgi:hypothetical protein
MKVKLLSTLLVFACQLGFSQTEKKLKGTVSSDNSLMQGVEVINITVKTSVTTDAKGEFLIAAKVNDSLLFFSKEYHFNKLKLTQEIIDKGNLGVLLLKKPEELQEIIIKYTQKVDLKLLKKYEKIKRDEITAERFENRLKTPGIYDGIIDKGLNIARIGKQIFGIFAKEKEPAKKTPSIIKFKELARTSCDQQFYIQSLKLKPEQIALFLEFCDADPKSKTIAETNNVLSVMDFLFAKNAEFKKL